MSGGNFVPLESANVLECMTLEREESVFELGAIMGWSYDIVGRVVSHASGHRKITLV